MLILSARLFSSMWKCQVSFFPLDMCTSPIRCLHSPADTLEVMDGLTAVRRIRELEREGKLRRHIPIIAVTANARAEQREGALEAGMNSVITKPFRIPDVMEKMKYWILETNARLAVDRRTLAGR